MSHETAPFETSFLQEPRQSTTVIKMKAATEVQLVKKLVPQLKYYSGLLGN
jgi:hypothetical protein